MEILQARILEWVATSSSGDLPNPGIEPSPLESPALAGRFFTEPPEKPDPSRMLLKSFLRLDLDPLEKNAVIN